MMDNTQGSTTTSPFAPPAASQYDVDVLTPREAAERDADIVARFMPPACESITAIGETPLHGEPLTRERVRQILEERRRGQLTEVLGRHGANVPDSMSVHRKERFVSGRGVPARRIASKGALVAMLREMRKPLPPEVQALPITELAARFGLAVSYRVEIREVPFDVAKLSLEEVAATFGIPMEELASVVPTGDERRAKLRAEHEVAAKTAERERLQRAFEERVAWAVEHDRRCVVCGAWVLRRTRRTGNITCSPKCARIWPVVRFVLNDEAWKAHRIQAAQSALKRRLAKLKPWEIAYFERIIAGQEAQRRYHIPGSQVGEVLARIRPDALPPASSGKWVGGKWKGEGAA